MSTFTNRILFGVAASAILAVASPLALTSIAPVAYADDSASSGDNGNSGDGVGDPGPSAGSADTGHDKGDGKGHDKGDGKGHDKGDGKGHDKGEGKGVSKGGEGEGKGPSKGASPGHASGHK